MAPQSDLVDPIYDDMTIAEGLLKNSKVPRRTSSFTGTQNLSRSAVQFRSSGTLANASVVASPRRAVRTSNTWTSSEGDVLSDQDEVDDRAVFIHEFNRLARKHGVRPMEHEDCDPVNDYATNLGHKDSWFSRKILRRTSSSQSVKPERQLKHRRSISDLSSRMKLKKDKLKDKGLSELARLCGSSLLYLPTEYAAGSLAVPTCFRATAQFLVQYGTTTRGVFRIPGSHHVVAALYNHYCSMDQNGEAISGTVRCPTLPEHIRCDVHDVASAFKKFISGLPGGILGSLSLFDSLISIQTQLQSDPEWTRTKQSKVRARLIALAIATLRSHYRREFICAVFGLLCMIGRAAETARREDDKGRPLPTSDLMGYGPLGIVFGPLLVGDLLEDYTMRLANPHGGLILLPISPPKSRKERKKKSKSGEAGTSFNTYVDKIKVANSIAEMLIIHWREVIRHMKDLNALKVAGGHKSLGFRGAKPPFLRPSVSEQFAIRKPPDWDDGNPMQSLDRSPSPTPMRRVSRPVETADGNITFGPSDGLQVRKQRSRSRPLPTQRLSAARSLSLLSPTVEENLKESEYETTIESSPTREKPNILSSSKKKNMPPPNDIFQGSISRPHSVTESACSVSQEKPKTIHPQPIDQLGYMERNLSLVTETPARTPKSFLTLGKEATLNFGQGIAAERAPHHIEPAKISSAAQPPPTLLRPLSPSPPSQSMIRGNGPVAWAKKALSRNLQSSKETVAPSNKSDPKVLTPRASTRDSEYESSKTQRRLRGSDPGMRVRIPERSPRKVSKSLYDDTQRKSKLLELDHKKKFPRMDPLSTVSQEDDLASLTELAQALNFLEEQNGANSPSKNNSAKQESSSNLCSQKRTAASESTREASTSKNLENVDVAAPNTNQAAKNEEMKIEDKKYRLSGISQKPQSPFSEAKSGYSSTPKRILISKSPVTPLSQTKQQCIPRTGPAKRPASPSTKFSALLAKFNNPDSQSTPESSPSKPPKKSLTDFLAADDQKRVDSQKYGLVAPYTTNSPSPSKSQRSGKSAITPKSRPGSLISSRKLPFDAALDFSRRISAAPLNTANSFPDNVTSSKRQSSVTGPPPLGCRKSPCPLEGTSPSEANTADSPDEGVDCENAKEVQDEPCSSVDCSALTSSDHVIEHVTACAMKMPALFQSLISPEVAPNLLPVVPTEVATFDGPSGSLNLNKLPITLGSAEDELNRPKSSHSLAEKASFVHPDSPFKDVFTASSPINPTVSPPLPGRSNSVLYAQIRILQKQLAEKTEEVRQLRKQVEARSSLDIGTLSDQLKEAKKEIQHWKSRAEVAEKQVELFTKLPLRPKSRQPSGELSAKSSQRVFERSNTEGASYPGEAAEMAASIRKALHGMDGAGSPPRWSSEESTETVIREPINGSD